MSNSLEATPPLHSDELLTVIRRRRSVRRFEKGRSVPREMLLRIAECGRWAPTGANAQCFDIVIVDEPEMRRRVRDVFVRQSQRLVDHAKGFPAVKKTYLANTVAIFVVLGDPRWKCCFPQASMPEYESEYAANNERIYLASLGAVVQNLQLGVTASGLTSAWLSGGGERTTNEELRALLGYPGYMEAIATIPVGYPEKQVMRTLPPAAEAARALEPLSTLPAPTGRTDRVFSPRAAGVRDLSRQRERARMARRRGQARDVEGGLHRHPANPGRRILTPIGTVISIRGRGRLPPRRSGPKAAARIRGRPAWT